MASAIYFDGLSAAEHKVDVVVTANGLRLDGADTPSQLWAFRGLEPIERFHPHRPFRISHKSRPGARVILSDDTLITDLIAHAPHLKGGFHMKAVKRIAGWTAGSLAVTALGAYLVLQLAPSYLAFILPDSWRNRVGQQIEMSLTEGARQCHSTEGDTALAAVVARLAEGNPGMPPITVRVYAVPVMNAFAMPGDRIVMTGELIRQAENADQVAGVLAHELGHVTHRHSEAQLVRATGLQLLLSLLTGGGSDTIGSIAGLAAILNYSRQAEAEADDFAVEAMEASDVDPMALRGFFEMLLKQEGKPSTGAFGKITSALNTHPGTEDRIDKIHPLPAGHAIRPVLSTAQWQALRNICKS